MGTIEKITSRENRRLAAVRKVRSGDDRERIFIEGRRLAREAINSGQIVEEVYFVTGFRDSELVELIVSRAGSAFELSEKLFRSVADTDESQGVILIAKRPVPICSFSSLGLSEIKSTVPMLVYLKEANNPSNLGAIIRTCEAAGVNGVVVSPRSADAFSPKALRAAMGSSFRLDVWTGIEYEELISWARRENVRIVATSPSRATLHTKVDWTVPSVVVFGSEAHGLTDNELREADETITVAIEEPVESLNLAAAVAVILFEARRQNSK